MVRAWIAFLLAGAVLIGVSENAAAQLENKSRTIKGLPNTDLRVGVYVNVRPDCTAGPLPSIQLTSQPEHGKVTVKRGKVSATNYKQCLAFELPGFIAFYRSRPDFSGTDAFTLEVKFPDGNTQQQRFNVIVGDGKAGQGI